MTAARGQSVSTIQRRAEPSTRHGRTRAYRPDPRLPTGADDPDRHDNEPFADRDGRTGLPRHRRAARQDDLDHPDCASNLHRSR